MSTRIAIYADRLEEVAETFIGRMRAPDQEDLFACLQKPWWKRDVGVGLLCGLAIGVVAFLMVPSYSSRPPPVTPEQHSLAPVAAAPALSDTVSHRPERPEERTRRRTSRVGGVSYRKLIRQGWRRYKRGQYSRASVAFARAVHRNPHVTGGYYGLAISLFEQGREDVALQVLKRASGRPGSQAGLWVLLGAAYQWSGNEEMARRAYRRYLHIQPHGAFARDIRVLLAHERLPVLRFEDIGE